MNYKVCEFLSLCLPMYQPILACLYIYLSACPTFYLSIHQYISCSVCLSSYQGRLPVCLSIKLPREITCLSVYLFVCLSASLLVSHQGKYPPMLGIYPFFCLSICLTSCLLVPQQGKHQPMQACISIYPSVCLYFFLSVCLSVYLCLNKGGISPC